MTYVILFMVIPLGFILAYSFMQRGAYGGVLAEYSLSNYTRALDPIYIKVLITSIVIAAATTALALLIGYPVAYAMTLLPKKWQSILLMLIVLPFWTNFLIRTYAWILLLNSEGIINKALLSLGVISSPLEVLYTPGAVVVGLLYGYLPLMILPIYSSLERIDPTLREAAVNLGATRRETFTQITLPLSLSGAMVGSIFVFVPSVGNFIVPELLGGGKTVMVGNLIRDQFLKARDWPFGSVLALVLVVMLVALFALQARVSRKVSG
jgi:spermidine/putrescine transport system permease protein